MAHHYGEYTGLEFPTPKAKKTIMVSGGFDPIHLGHCRMIQEAAKYGQLTVVANSDDWLRRKKGFAFMPFEERAEILSYMEGVHTVIQADDDDGTICETLRKYRPDIFANGGDRTVGNTPEMKVCDETKETRKYIGKVETQFTIFTREYLLYNEKDELLSKITGNM